MGAPNLPRLLAIGSVLLGLALCLPARAEVQEVLLARQYGIGYLQFMVMEHDRLIEKHAKRLGLGDIKVKWSTLTDGAAMNDAILAGDLHVASGGIGPFLTLWARTRGTLDVKGIAAMSAMPLFLNTRNPRIRTLADFGPDDRIALAGVKVSPQATALEYAAAKAFGEENWAKLDPLTVNMPHPMGMQAMLSGSEITSHFTSPPYQYLELEQPGVHTVLNSYEVWGGKQTTFMAWTTSRFRDANPKTYEAVYAALEEATRFISTNRRAAAEIYVEMTREKETVDAIAKFLADPDIEYTPVPHRMQQFAEFRFRIGTIKARPASWKDLFFPDVHTFEGD